MVTNDNYYPWWLSPDPVTEDQLQIDDKRLIDEFNQESQDLSTANELEYQEELLYEKQNPWLFIP